MPDKEYVLAVASVACAVYTICPAPLFSSIALALAGEVMTGAVRSRLTVIALESGLSRPPEVNDALSSLLPSTPKLARLLELKAVGATLICVADRSLLVSVF